MGLIEENKQDIIFLHTIQHWSANMIAKKYECSRQGILHALREWGIDTSKAKAGWVENTCPCGCGRIFPVKRSRLRKVLEEGKTGLYWSKECRMKGEEDK